MSFSRDSDRPAFPFNVKVQRTGGSVSHDSEIRVLDAWDIEVASGQGSIQQTLPRGLYTVRVSRAGKLQDKVIKHRDRTNVTIGEPLRVSAVPSLDTIDSHEYYSYTSQTWSNTDTRVAIGTNPRGRMFIFIRARNSESYNGKPLAENLRLTDEMGEVLSDFDPNECKVDTNGWLAFSAPAAVGLYLLRYNGPESREIPLYVYPRLSTQFFVMFQDGLRLDTASILLEPQNQSFDPEKRFTQAIDSALKGLQEGQNLLPSDMMQMLLHGKFHHPMLGLLGAHLLLLRPEVDPNLLNMVIGNLDNLLPDSPDVDALRIIASRRLGTPPPETVIGSPPMLRAGMEAVLALAAEQNQVTVEGSLVDRTATRQLVDLPWTSWVPIDKPRMNIEFGNNGKLIGQRETSESEWVTRYVEDAIENAEYFGHEVELSELAADVAVPYHAIEQAYRLVSSQRKFGIQKEPDDLQKIHGIGPETDQLLRRMGYSTLDDIVSLGPEDMERIKHRLGRSSGLASPNKWVAQAMELTSKKETF